MTFARTLAFFYIMVYLHPYDPATGRYISSVVMDGVPIVFAEGNGT
jgi:hypothetical protein